MEPVFDEGRNLVAWLHVGSGVIYDPKKSYIAFERNNGLFSLDILHLGYFLNGVFWDHWRKPVAYLLGADPGIVMPNNIPFPARPSRKPSQPTNLRFPAVPANPPLLSHGKFSLLGWDQLIGE
ncbi:4-fold beta flower protein [Paraburkholderia sp. GAS334]|uniref:4-fold beta flower protein n=1 Tax=Paraburkholderia sp. GAS334 TaxID=3035131 RepID=UPI003D1C1947